MVDEVKTPTARRYRSARRAEQAAGTRHRILAAAQALFTEHGYTATSVAQIAARAEVAVDTLYATVGRKPALLRELLEAALSGADETVPAEQRDYVRIIRAVGTAGEKIAVYAEAVARIGFRMAPVHRALAEAALRDSGCAALRGQISARRAANMRLFAADLRATGELRADLTDDDVADIIWSMNAAEYYALLVGERGWTAERFQAWLVDAWTRTLLGSPESSEEDGRRAR
ncbi:MAG: TetR family transcriptional regulator [Jatrophihabitantaceae bacterium]